MRPISTRVISNDFDYCAKIWNPTLNISPYSISAIVEMSSFVTAYVNLVESFLKSSCGADFYRDVLDYG